MVKHKQQRKSTRRQETELPQLWHSCNFVLLGDSVFVATRVIYGEATPSTAKPLW